MSEAPLAAIIGGIAGAITGAITSLLSPWIHWRIEKRRNQAQRQREIIDEARAEFFGSPQRREDIRQGKSYAAMRHHLSPELVAEIERNRVSGGEANLQQRLLEEIAALEKKWNLV